MCFGAARPDFLLQAQKPLLCTSPSPPSILPGVPSHVWDASGLGPIRDGPRDLLPSGLKNGWNSNGELGAGESSFFLAFLSGFRFGVLFAVWLEHPQI